MHARSSEEIAGPLDEARVNWDDVREATYVVQQRFRYDYPGPIADLHHRLMIVPRERHGAQRRIATRLDVTPHAVAHDAHDVFGNPVATFFARRIDGTIEFTHRSIVTRTRMEHVAHPGDVDDARLRTPTPLTAADAALRDAAASLRAGYADPVARADALCAFVFAEMRYVAGSTDVETTAAMAFARRRGVCQDYAHVAIALARHGGLAARYVSGHLLGEGGTHAWIELLVRAGDGAGAVVLAYDPTHGRRVDMRYVAVALGRDYADVAPTSGVFTAPYAGVLTASKRVAATSVAYDP
ncbi:MAG: transglutaminase family protein [Vulcanimicrobiaceae bacterium]